MNEPTQSRPERVFIETTTRCNLACPMCARTGPGWEGGAGDMPLDVFERLAPVIAGARAVVLNGMGEPLLHPDLPEMVRRVKALQPPDGWCGIQTNGLLLTEALAARLAEAGLDVVCLSHDGDAPLGHGKGAEATPARVAALFHAAGRAAGKTPRLGLETVLMAGNAASLPALVDRAAGLGFGFLLVSHLLPMDAASEAEGLFLAQSPRSLRHYEAWREKAQAQGLDLSLAGRTALRHLRTEDDERLLALAREMRESAREQGIWLNMDSLAQAERDGVDGSVRLALLEDLFARARERAAAAGIELRLPAPAAPDEPHQRACPFVAAPSVFVDWRGLLSPCHFLWHSYRCRVLGDDMRVWAQHFGDSCVTDPLEAWRAPEFAVFRHEALAAEYPACGDCGVALCSDVSGLAGPFERDCLGAGVPCGICPWALGQLMCLGA